ncbi:unnamed protein product [Caenorhabditis brenneri]
METTKLLHEECQRKNCAYDGYKNIEKSKFRLKNWFKRECTCGKAAQRKADRKERKSIWRRFKNVFSGMKKKIFRGGKKEEERSWTSSDFVFDNFIILGDDDHFFVDF